MKLFTTAVLAFAFGFFTHFGVSRLNDDGDIDVARHWRLVDGYRAFTNDPSNLRAAENGMMFVSQPYEIEPSLAALVAADELCYVDIVLPNVAMSRETELHWMKFVAGHADAIVYATGNPQHVNYKSSGVPPLHLQLWFKEAAKSDVQRLVTELESLPEPTSDQMGEKLSP